MEMPITKPSMVSYADEVDFAEILEKLLKDRHNGFIRVTSGSDEGFILFENGKQLAASYERYSKSEAIDQIKSAMEKDDTVIEIFDLRPSHIDYLLDVNKPYILEPDYDINKVIEDLKSKKSESEPSISELLEDKTESEVTTQNETEIDSKTMETTKSEFKIEPEPEPVPEPEKTVTEPSIELQTPKSETSDKTINEPPISETKTEPEQDTEAKETVSAPISEPKQTETTPEEIKTEPVADNEPETNFEPVTEPKKPEPSSVTEPKKTESEHVPEPKIIEPTPEPAPEPAPEPEPELEQLESEPVVETKPTVSENVPEQGKTESEQIKPQSAPISENSTETAEDDSEKMPDLEADKFTVKDESTKKYMESKNALKEELKTMEAKPEKEVDSEVEVKEKPVDRTKLLKKYGIKEMNEDDVDDLLDTYKGGSLNDEDVEKIELALMNKIKKSIFGIPKIKGAEVMVFLENAAELTGDINIIIEYETQGFFSRLMGESKTIENLRRQVINIAQIEIKKSFRKYPEIVNNFNINVEIS
ncbi:MAG: DUF2226 domain-containing protein [Methanobacterium sp.]|nr:DUF2226 domain-containing protein [Methanobacterium sp.]